MFEVNALYVCLGSQSINLAKKSTEKEVVAILSYEKVFATVSSCDKEFVVLSLL